MDVQQNIPENQSNQVELQPKRFFSRHSRSIWLSLLTVAMAVAALLGYILFFRKAAPQTDYSGGEVSVKISAPRESVSGSEISFELTIENHGATKLTWESLEMFYPPGFSFIRSQLPSKAAAAAIQIETGALDSSDNSAQSGRTFSLPDLPRDEKQTLVIVGRLEGNVQEIKTVTAKLHYVPENFNSPFLAEGSAGVVILSPRVALRVLGPASVISGQIIEYEAELRNVSTDEFRNLTMELSYPPGFAFQEATPPASSPGTGTETKGEWHVASLLPGEAKTVRVKGRLSDAPGEEVFLTAELFLVAQEGKLSAGRSYTFTKMLPPPLVITQRLVGGEGTVFGGETLQYEVSYENVGEIGLSNVMLAVRFETAVFDLTKAKSQTGQIRGNEMVWLSAAVSELRTVQIGQRGEFTMEVPLRAESQLTQKNPVAQTGISFSADELSEPIAGDDVSVKLGTNLKLTATVDLISGSKDPDVGQTSVFLVAISVENTVNDVEQAELTARLPGSDVTFDESSLAPLEERGNFEFLSAGGLLRWRLGKIFAYSGAIHAPRTLSFRVSITPEKRESGTPVLLEDMEVAGTDGFTSEQIFSNKLQTVKAR